MRKGSMKITAYSMNQSHFSVESHFLSTRIGGNVAMQTNTARIQHTTVRRAWRFSQWCTENSVLEFFLDNSTPIDEDTTLPGNVRSDNQHSHNSEQWIPQNTTNFLSLNRQDICCRNLVGTWADWCAIMKTVAAYIKEVLHLKLSLNEKEGTCRWHRIQLYNRADSMEKPDLHKQTTPTLCR